MGHSCILIDSGMDLSAPTWPSSGAVLRCERPPQPDRFIDDMWNCSLLG